jgi:predicted RNase H-like HicB family nuclease
MAMTILEETPYRTAAPQQYIEAPAWQSLDENTYECRVLLCPEEEGGYSAHALRLPGVVSQGESEQEALENIVDAFRAAVSLYREQGAPIPWSYIEMDRPKGSIERWILVKV